MRSIAFGTLALLLMVPLAAADQDITAGPARAQTVSSAWGGGCSSANGGEQHYAIVDVDVAANERVQIYYSEFCSTYDDGSYSYEYAGQSLQLSRVHGNNYGPTVAYSWSSFQDGFGNGFCSDMLFLSGPQVYLGCLADPQQRVLIGPYLP